MASWATAILTSSACFGSGSASAMTMFPYATVSTCPLPSCSHASSRNCVYRWINACIITSLLSLSIQIPQLPLIVPTCSITLTSPLEFPAIGMQDDGHRDHAEHEAGQAQADDEDNGCRIHTHSSFRLAVAAPTTPTEQ